MKWILVVLMVSTQAFANISKAPVSFNSGANKAIFVDFTRVETTITYNLDNKKVLAETHIEFTASEKGSPLFDVVPSIKTATLNGKHVKITKIADPSKITEYRMVSAEIEAGSHKLMVRNEFDENVDFKGSYVSSAFWMSDLTDRKYLERYIPANLEFDQYQMTLNVKVIGTKKAELHEVFANGIITKNALNDFTIVYPEYFTTSSYFFHMTKKDRFPRSTFNFQSNSGKVVPVIIYAKYAYELKDAVKSTKEVLAELEAKIGAWPHPSLTIYVAGRGGMEHSGATITSLWALQHEICHSYFARGVMPIDGNSGWMDEAIASWRDDGYKSAKLPNFSTTRMSGQSNYKRFTDRKAYTEGANFMAYLNHKLSKQGGLIKFLAHMHNTYSQQNISTQIFKKELEMYSGMDFTADFKKYILGSKSEKNHKHSHAKKNNPYHPQLSAKELKDLL